MFLHFLSNSSFTHLIYSRLSFVTLILVSMISPLIAQHEYNLTNKTITSICHTNKTSFCKDIDEYQTADEVCNQMAHGAERLYNQGSYAACQKPNVCRFWTTIIRGSSYNAFVYVSYKNKSSDAGSDSLTFTTCADGVIVYSLHSTA